MNKNNNQKINIMTTKNSNKVSSQLNQVLADLQVVYQNLRTMHWLVQGPQLHQLHKLYEEMYNQTAETIDEVAERVLMLGQVPLHTYADYLKVAKVEVVTQVPKGLESLKTALENQQYLLNGYRELISLASENSDEGTVALASELIASTEKRIWMLGATLS